MERSGDYWTGLLAFARSAETGSFTAAGQALGLSPSAVSRATARLEGRLGVALLKRSTRSLRLTEAGRTFFEEIGPALAALREAEGSVTGERTGVRGTLHLSVPIDVGRELAAPWCEALIARHPGLSIELRVSDRLANLRQEGIDLALRLGGAPPGNYRTTRLGALGYAVVAAPDYLARRGTPGTPADLADHACLQYIKLDGRHMPWPFVGEETRTAGPFASDDGGALRAAAVAGVGVACLLRFNILAELGAGRLVEVMTDVPKEALDLFVFHPFGAHPPARVRAAVAHFARSVRGAR